MDATPILRRRNGFSRGVVAIPASKRPRYSPPAVCSTTLSVDTAFFVDKSAHHVANSVIIPPHYTPSTKDDGEDADLECNVFPARHATFQEPIDSVEPRNFDDDTMFDKYFRFPSPSSSPSTDN